MPSENRSRLMVVLFVDQVGSTAVLTRLGDHVAYEIRHTLHTLLQEAIADHRGQLVKSTGDGCMAVFDSAADAIDAGITMHRRAARANRLPNAPAEIRLRVGVSVGDVTEEADDYHGTAVVEAARLEQAASESGMLCSDLTRALAGNRSTALFAERTDIDAKGFTEPIAAWVVRWEDEPVRPLRDLPHELGAGGRFDFVGRADDLEAARSAWAGTLDGDLTGLLVTGEPGVGKTRLARELAIETLADGATVLYGRCDDGVGAAFQPIAQAVAQFVEQGSVDVSELGRFPGELRRLLPELPSLVHGLPDVVEADSGTEQFRLFDAVLSWLESTAEQSPVLLVVDDIQWAARPTLLLIRHLLRRGSESPVCVLCTYRSTEADQHPHLVQFLGEVQRHGRTATIDLVGLDESGISELLDRAGLDAAQATPDAALVQRLAKATGGNAFFLGEVITLLQEHDPDHLLASLDTMVPDMLGEIVVDRVARTSPMAIELLDVAAVAGSEVSLDVLAVASGRSRADLVDAADEVLRAGLMIEVSASPISYRFQHDLVRSTLYDRMSAGRRTQRHHDIAHAIDEVFARDLSSHLDDLAHHYSRSTDPDDANRAVITAQLAGDQAIERLSFSTAAEHYAQALAAMDRYGCTHPEHLRGRLTLGLGVARKRAGIGGSRALLLAAAEIARANDDPATVVQAALANTRGFFSSAGRTDDDRVLLLEMALGSVDPDDSAHTAKLMANLSVELTFGDDEERRRMLSERSLAMAERLGDPVCLAHVVNQRIGFCWNARGLAERLELCARLQTIADELQSPQWQYTSASSTFQAAMESGDLALAAACIEQMRAAAEELRQPVVRSYLRMRESVHAIVAGDLDTGEQLATECFEIGQAAGQPDALTFYFGQLINLRFHQGRMSELESIVAQEAVNNPGIPSLQAGLAVLYCEVGELDRARQPYAELTDRLDDIHHDLSWLVMTVLLAEACFQLGDVDRAGLLHRRLAPFRHQCADNATNWYGTVERYLAMLEHTLGRFDEADASFASATERHVAMPAPAVLARTRLDWATSLLRRPDPDRDAAERLIELVVPEAARMRLGALTVRADQLAALA